jgi:hypothetical protein
MMEPTKHKWEKQISVEELFNTQWTIPRKNLLKEFL